MSPKIGDRLELGVREFDRRRAYVLFSICATELLPGIGIITGDRVSSHAKAPPVPPRAAGHGRMES